MSTTLEGKPAPRSPAPPDYALLLQQRAVFGETKRFRTLDRYEAHYRSTQYDHQKFDWWGKNTEYSETISADATSAPAGMVNVGAAEGLTVRDKRPTAPANLCKTIVNRYTSLLLSNQRKPRVLVDRDQDTEGFLEAVRENSNFWQAARALRNKGGSEGSACMTVHMREGTFVYEVHNPKHLTPIWKDRRGLQLAGVLKMYRYPVEVDEVDPKTGRPIGTREVEFLYRRIITDKVDIVYEPLNLETMTEATWEPAPGGMVEHGLGYFPGVWVQNRVEDEDYDGAPDCDGAWATIDTIDRLLAQMNKSVILNCDPTPVVKTDPKEVQQDNPGVGSESALNVGVSGDAKYMEFAGTGVTVGLVLLQRLRQNALDMTSTVLPDPGQLSGAARSARAIEFLYAPMLECADELRDQYGPALVSIMRITAAMARAFQAAHPAVADGTGRTMFFLFALPLRTITAEGPDGAVVEQQVPYRVGPGGFVHLEWGPYFSSTADDDQAKITNASSARAAGFITRKTAASYVAKIFGVKDVDSEVAEAQQELEEDGERMMAAGAGGVFPGEPPAPAARDRDHDPPAAGAGGNP